MNNFKEFIKKHQTLSRCADFGYKYYFATLWYILLVAGNTPSLTVRHTVYRVMGLKLGQKSCIYGQAEIRAPNNISIGNHTIINHRAVLDGRGGLKIGNNVNLATGVWIWTAQHDENAPSFRMLYGPVEIEDYVYVSYRVVVLPNTRIGKGAVVLPGAVVKGDVPQYSIVAGIPAKVVGERNRDLTYIQDNPVPSI